MHPLEQRPWQHRVQPTLDEMLHGAEAQRAKANRPDTLLLGEPTAEVDRRGLGAVEPQGKQRFPLFQTWREIASGDLLLPSRTLADDILRFPQVDVHYRVNVKYYDYKLFASKLTITEIDAPAQ